MSARLAIMARNTAQTTSALSGLVPGVYLAVAGGETVNKSSSGISGSSRTKGPSDNLSTALESMSLRDPTQSEQSETAPATTTYEDRKAEFASLLLLYHLCHTASFELYWSTLQALTAPRRRPLRQRHRVPTQTSSHVSALDVEQVPFISPDRLRIPRLCARYLSPHSFDPISFFRLALIPSGAESGCATPAVCASAATPHQSAIMQWAVPTARDRAWAVMRKAYLEVRVQWAGEWLGIRQSDASSGSNEEDGWGEEDSEEREQREHLEAYVKRQGRAIEAGTGRIQLR